MTGVRIEVFRSRKLVRQRWYFRVVDEQNGQVLAVSEAYLRRSDCEDTARRYGKVTDG